MALTEIPIELSSTPSIVDGGNATAITIDSSGNIGIGASPLTLSGNAAPGLTVSSNGPFILLQDANNADKVRYISNNTGDLQFGIVGDDGATGKTEHMRIDTSGNLLVGKIVQGLNNAGFEVAPSGQATATQSGASCLRLNRLSSNGELLQFRKDGATVGNISVISGDRMLFATADGLGLTLDKDNNRIVPSDATGGANANVSLGSSGLEFKDLYLSGGAYLGGTAAANKLDDYEEGTFSATATGTGTLSVVNEKYTKIGNVVTVYFQVDFSGASGDLTIGGLPFTSTPFTKSVGIGREDATSGYAVYGRLSSNSTSIAMYYTGATGNATPFQVAAGNFGFSITYFTNL